MDYARRRLERFVQDTERHGGFNEYNSPGYTLFVVRLCEWIAEYVSDPGVREHAAAVHRIAWQTIADHYHPATGQWAGPHSRNYHDLLPGTAVAYLADRTGVDIPSIGPTASPGELHFFAPVPCPPDIVPRFRELPEVPLTVRQRFIRRDTEEASTWGATWFDGPACLGTVNHDSLWTQRRPLIGYWCGEDGSVVVLRVRCLHNGRDFAGAYLRTVQDGPRVLWAMNLLTNQGDWHPTLDRAPDGTYRTRDLRVCIELVGTGVGLEGDGETFALAAGERTAFVLTAPGRLDDAEIIWEAAKGEDRVAVEGVLYTGPECEWKPSDVDCVVVAGAVELTGGELSGGAVSVDLSQSGQLVARWGDLQLTTPTCPERY